MAGLDQRVFDKGAASLFYVADTQLRLGTYLPLAAEHCLKLTDFAQIVAGNDQARSCVVRHRLALAPQLHFHFVLES